ncbi:MAG: exonuclease SbcCD subunit D [Acidimicrobiales bacterium]
MTGQSAGNNTATTGIAVPLRDPAAARIFHTSDWHLGVTVRNRSRADDHDAAIAELTAIAQAAAPDLIVHTGDLFDGHRPPMADFGRAIVALRNLAEIAPVVVLAGNHDSAAALEVLGTAVGDELPDQLASGPYDPLAPCRHRIRIHARPATAAKGAVATYSSAAGVDIRLTALPFVHANRVLKEFDQLAEANTTYADKLREIVDLLTKTALTDFDPSRQVAVFASHVHVTEAALSSERTVHVSTDYATDAGHLPAAYGYLAFGHIHVPQPVAGGRGRYAGSILEVDFGEEGETKQVVVVDLEPGRPARQHQIPLVAARKLRRVRAPLAELAALADDLGHDIVEVTVTPDPDGNDHIDGPIVLPGADDTFDTLSAAVHHLLPQPEIVSVIDARRSSVATADQLPSAAGAAVSVHQSYRAWLGDGGRSLFDKTPGADPARVVELFDELLTAVVNGDTGDLPEDEALLAAQLQGSVGERR